MKGVKNMKSNISDGLAMVFVGFLIFGLLSLILVLDKVCSANQPEYIDYKLVKLVAKNKLVGSFLSSASEYFQYYTYIKTDKGIKYETFTPSCTAFYEDDPVEPYVRIHRSFSFPKYEFHLPKGSIQEVIDLEEM